jgi:HEAT repeat protein
MRPGKALRYAVQLEQQKAQAREQRIQAVLTPLVRALTDPDEPRRQATVRHVQQTCVPAVIALLIDRLVALLGGSGTVQRQAVASLVQFGPRALPALTLRFSRSRSAAVQQGIIEALTAVARGLDRDGRLGLMTELLILSRRAADDSIRESVMGLLTVLRSSLETSGRVPSARAIKCSQ